MPPVHELPVPVPVRLAFMHVFIILGCWTTGAFAGSGEGGRGRGGRGRGRSGAAPGLPGGEPSGALPVPGIEAPAARCARPLLRFLVRLSFHLSGSICLAFLVFDTWKDDSCLDKLDAAAACMSCYTVILSHCAN